MCTYLENEEELIRISTNYGTPNSVLLKEIRAAGFKPIGITVIMCEETFIFKGEPEAKQAAKQFLPEGWWYGFGSWEDTWLEYVKKFYGGIEENAPHIHWLDENFAPKKSKHEIFNSKNR